MTNPVSQLDTHAQTANILKMVQATRTYLRVWQEGNFKFLSLLQENLQRHKAVFGECQDQTLSMAQGVIAQLQPSGLVHIVEALAEEPSSELLALAEEEAQAVVASLDRQVALLTRESRAVDGLPLVEGAADKERLIDELANAESLAKGAAGDSARFKAELDVVQKAIDILQANGLQTRFGGTVPSLETLSALATPGGEAVVAVEVISQAIKDLQTLLGDIVIGMRYSELQRQAQLLRDRASEADEGIRNAGQKQKWLTSNIALLETLPALKQHREQWQAAAAHLIQTLEHHRAAVGSIGFEEAADVNTLDTAFNRLLNLELDIVKQILS